MTPDVEQAIKELKESFESNKIEVEEESQGGAYIIIHDLEIGSQYSPSKTWIGFIIGFQYPTADVYPHYIDGAVKRVDDKPLIDPFSKTNWRDKDVWQISRRTNNLDPLTQTATSKLFKIIDWLRKQ
jgi:hypothetical protein